MQLTPEEVLDRVFPELYPDQGVHFVERHNERYAMGEGRVDGCSVCAERDAALARWKQTAAAAEQDELFVPQPYAQFAAWAHGYVPS